MSQLSAFPASLPRMAVGAPSSRAAAIARSAEHARDAISARGLLPWLIEVHPGSVVVRARPSRRAPVPDRIGREAALSAGAVLFELRVALAGDGWGCEVELLPRPGHPDVLAEVRPVPSTPDPALAALAPGAHRDRARRRSFTGAHLPDVVLRRLTDIAERDGVLLVPVVDAHRQLVESLIQQTDPPPRPGPADRTVGPARSAGAADGPALVLLATRADDEVAWLCAGQALQHVLLELGRLGWQATPLPGPTDVPLTRTRLRAALTWAAHPQMLVAIERPTVVAPAVRP